MVKRRIQIGVSVIMVMAVALAGLLGPWSSVSADDTASANSIGTANVIKVSPLRTDLSIAAGSSKTVQITVTNPTSTEIEISPIENDFVAQDESGTPSLILDATQYAPTHSLKRFLAPLDNVTIPAGQSKTIDVNINVPAGTQAGGYYGAIRLAPTSPDSGGQVNLSANVASLILLTVPGATVEKLNLTDFDVQQNGQSGATFQTPNNLQVYLRFENKGNVQIGPFGKISVKQGSKVIYDYDFNSATPQDVILPDAARRWDVPLKNIGNFGHYTVVATLSYGTNNQTIEVTKSFWVVPLSVIIAAIAGLVLIILIVVGIILFLRSYKRRVLRKYGRR